MSEAGVRDELRKIGVGVMGLAEMLALLGIPLRDAREPGALAGSR